MNATEEMLGGNADSDATVHYLNTGDTADTDID